MDHRTVMDLAGTDAAAYIRKSRLEEGMDTQEVLSKHQKALVELAWKSLREYMEDQGAAMDAVFSKQVFKAAYAAGLIHNEQVWLDMLASRNVTSHVYDDTQAAQVVSAIRDRYISPLTELAQFYQAD